MTLDVNRMATPLILSPRRGRMVSSRIGRVVSTRRGRMVSPHVGWIVSLYLLATALSIMPLGAPPASASPDAPGQTQPTLLFMTDFGLADDAVAICKGVMLDIAPGLRILDLTHDVTPFDVREGAYYLAQTAPYYPKGTVFVAVVDPGVGTERSAIVIETARGQLFVGPDNGLLSLVAEKEGVRAIHEVTNPDFMRPNPSPTFHGRDVFAPCGAKLAARGRIQDVGPRRDDLVRLAVRPAAHERGRITAEVALLDKSFGNVWTNIPREMVQALLHGAGGMGGEGAGASGTPHASDEKREIPTPPRLAVTIGEWKLTLPLVQTFGDVREGEPLAYYNSRNELSFAINLGSFAARYGVMPGDVVAVEIAL